MTVRAWAGRSSTFLMGTLVVASSLTGCASTPETTPRITTANETPPVSNGLETLAAESSRPAADPRTLDADGMAAQFQRDIDAMTRLRDRQPGGSSETPANPNRTREIAWNAPGEVSTPLIPEAGGAANSGANQSSTTTPTSPAESEINPAPKQPTALPTHELTMDDQPAEVRLRELMVSLSSQLYRDAAYADSPLPQYLLIASMSMVAPERALNPDALPDLNEREREILRAYQTFFTEVGAQLRATGDTELLVEAIDQLRTAVREEPSLTIPRAALCWRVRGYGQYDEFNRNSFLAQSGQQVIVYTEIDDFTSERNEKGEWVTELSEELVIHNLRDGIPVWRQAPMSVPDVSRNQRREFFISHIITLPKSLPVGAYSLKVRVRDEKSNAVAETTIDFTIVADASLAARIPD